MYKKGVSGNRKSSQKSVNQVRKKDNWASGIGSGDKEK